MAIDHVRVTLDLAYDSDHELHPAQWDWRALLQIPEVPGVRTCRVLRIETVHFKRREVVEALPEIKIAGMAAVITEAHPEVNA